MGMLLFIDLLRTTACSSETGSGRGPMNCASNKPAQTGTIREAGVYPPERDIHSFIECNGPTQVLLNDFRNVIKRIAKARNRERVFKMCAELDDLTYQAAFLISSTINRSFGAGQTLYLIFNVLHHLHQMTKDEVVCDSQLFHRFDAFLAHINKIFKCLRDNNESLKNIVQDFYDDDTGLLTRRGIEYDYLRFIDGLAAESGKPERWKSELKRNPLERSYVCTKIFYNNYNISISRPNGFIRWIRTFTIRDPPVSRTFQNFLISDARLARYAHEAVEIFTQGAIHFQNDRRSVNSYIEKPRPHSEGSSTNDDALAALKKLRKIQLSSLSQMSMSLNAQNV